MRVETVRVEELVHYQDMGLLEGIDEVVSLKESLGWAAKCLNERRMELKDEVEMVGVAEGTERAAWSECWDIETMAPSLA